MNNTRREIGVQRYEAATEQQNKAQRGCEAVLARLAGIKTPIIVLE